MSKTNSEDNIIVVCPTPKMDRPIQDAHKGIVIVPDEGMAWIVLFAGFGYNFILGGFLRCFGLFYKSFIIILDISPFMASWISFTFMATCTLTAVAGGFLSDRFDMRRLSMAVCVVASCAFAAPALTGNIYLILAITGGISGAGMGIVEGFVLGHVNRCFLVYRSMANAISFSGGRIGSLVMPMFFHWAVTNSGYKDSMMFISGILIHTTVVCAVMWPVISVPQNSLQSEESKENVFSIKLLNFKSRSDLPNSLTRGNYLSNTHRNESVKRPRDDMVNNEIDHNNDNRNAIHGSSNDLKTDIEIEKSTTSNNSPFGIFTNIPLLVDMLALFLGCFPVSGMFHLWPVYLQEQKMQDFLGPLSITVAAAAELTMCPLLGLFLTKYSDQKRVFTSICWMLAFAGTIAMPFMADELPWLLLCSTQGLFGGVGLITAIPMMAENVKPEQMGSLGGMFVFIFGTTSAIGPVIFSSLQKMTGGFRSALLFSSALYIPAALLLLLADKCFHVSTTNNRRNSMIVNA